jgi:regulator of replication initiation timing
MVIHNNNNSDISDSDDDPTVDLEAITEADYAEFIASADPLAESDLVSEIEGTQATGVDADAPLCGDTASEIQDLRDELKYRVEMHSILQLGNDQLSEKCDSLTEQVSSILKASETLSNELERSRQHVTRTKLKLARARDSKQALLISLKKLDTTDTGNAVISEQDDAIEELRKDKLKLTDTVSSLKTKLELATQNTGYLETQMTDASAENSKLSAELKSRNAQIDDYKSQLAALRRTPMPAKQTSPNRATGTRLVPGSHAEDCLVLVGLNGAASDTYIVGDELVTIGSSPDSDIQVQSQFVSRHHAQVKKTPNGCVLADLNSTNGTFINARRINKRVLKGGDLVTIGKHRFRYEKRSAGSIMTDTSELDHNLNSSGNSGGPHNLITRKTRTVH